MSIPQDNQLQNDLPSSLAQPALRAFSGAGIHSLTQLVRFSESEIRQLPGIGPNALEKLHSALAKKGLGFKTQSMSNNL